MSCDWDVWCLDCDEGHGFSDANHQRNLMAALAKLGPQLAKFAPTMRAIRAIEGAYVDANLYVTHDRLPIDFDWFDRHVTHRLIARDEYGKNDDECGEYFACCACQHRRQCRRTKGHDGDHAPERDA